MIFSDNYNSTIRVFSFAVVLLISFTAIACEDITDSDEEKVLANYTDQYTFNFSTDSVSIIIEQGFEELGRGPIQKLQPLTPAWKPDRLFLNSRSTRLIFLQTTPTPM